MTRLLPSLRSDSIARSTPLRALIGATLLVAALAPRAARADDLEGDVVYVPMPAGESLTVENRLGTVRVRGWDEPRVKVVAHKRAQSPALLERVKVRVDLDGGKVRVATGVYFSDGVWRPLPLAGAAIDLTIDAPRVMAVGVTTWAGEIDASGFRAGARLESQQGEIRAADLAGKVDTRTRAGRQTLQSIHGPLEASGVESDVELDAVDGETLEAVVFRGTVTARECRSPVVRLRTTRGAIVFVGTLAAGGRYELAALDGDVRLALRPTPFHLVARGPLHSALRLDKATSTADGVLTADYRGGGATLDLATSHGAVSLAPLTP